MDVEYIESLGLFEREMRPSDLDAGIDPVKLLALRAERFAAELIPGLPIPPYATDEEVRAALLHINAGRVRIDKFGARRAFVVGGSKWIELPINVAAELIRLQYLRRFFGKGELMRIGWEEMGWDGDRANWYGLPC